MQFQATPRTLAEVWALPVGAFNPGMRQFEQMQQADQGALQRLATDDAYKQQERPLLLEQLAGQNRNRNAELPGIQARGKMAQMDADKRLATYDADIEGWFSQNRDKVNKAHFEEVLRAGPMMQQLAELAAYNPQSVGRIREIMTQRGLGDFWNPEWDNASPQDVSAGLYDFGNALTNATPSMQKLMQQLESKETIAAEKNKTALELAERRAQLGRELAALRARGGKGGSKASLPRLEQLLGQAYQSGDMESAAQIADTMRYVRQRDEVKPQIDTTQVPILKPPAPAVNPLRTQQTPKPKTGDKLPDGSIYIE